MVIGLVRLNKNRQLPYWSCVPIILLATVLITSCPARSAAADGGYTLPPVTQLTAAAYGNGAYVVAGTSYTGTGISAIGSFVALTSTDGTNWTVEQPLPDMNIWNIYQMSTATAPLRL